MATSRMHTGAQRASMKNTRGFIETMSALASASHGIDQLHINVFASILLITSCFDHVLLTVLMPAYPKNRFTDVVKFSFEGTELLMEGNQEHMAYCSLVRTD